MCSTASEKENTDRRREALGSESAGSALLGGRGERGESKDTEWHRGGLEGTQDRQVARQSHGQAPWPRGFVGFAFQGLGSGHCPAIPSCAAPSKGLNFCIHKLGRYWYLPPRVDVRLNEVLSGSPWECLACGSELSALSCSGWLAVVLPVCPEEEAVAASPTMRVSVQPLGIGS